MAEFFSFDYEFCKKMGGLAFWVSLNQPIEVASITTIGGLVVKVEDVEKVFDELYAVLGEKSLKILGLSSVVSPHISTLRVYKPDNFEFF